MTATANVAINISASEPLSAPAISISAPHPRCWPPTTPTPILYGLVSGAGAAQQQHLADRQPERESIGASTLEAWGLINIYAGQSGDGDNANGINTSTLTADATTTVYNYALIPISAKYKGSATADDYTTLTLATGSQVLGVNNVFIGATQGLRDRQRQGDEFYNPHLSLFSTENHDNNSSTDGSGNVVLNGVVAAGIQNQELGHDRPQRHGVVALFGGSPYAGSPSSWSTAPSGLSARS